MRFLLSLLILTRTVFCLSVAPKEITVGDPIYIRCKEKVIVSSPFELWDMKKEGDVFVYRGSIYMPGAHIIKIKTSKGEEKVRIRVLSVLKGGEELQDIEGVKEVAASPRRFIRVVSLVAGLFLAFFVFKLLRKLVFHLLFPRELSQEELLGRKLEGAMSYAKKGMWVDFYSELSRAVREFLYYKLSVPALTATVREMETIFIKSFGLEEVVRLLEQADKKRFSMERSSLPEAEDYIRKIKEMFLEK